MENRPSGRKKNVTGSGKTISRRGSGLGTGPVGGSSRIPSGGHSSGKPSGSNSSGGQSSGVPSGGHSSGNQSYGAGSSGTRASGNVSLIGIIIAVVIALVGGGFGINSFLGGIGEPSSNSGISDTLASIFGNLGGGSVSTGWTSTSNTGGEPDTSVAPGSRAKYTAIQGNNRDTVTIMIYMCGTDLESKSGMATNDLNEMKAATISGKVNIIVYTGGCKQWKTSGISNTTNQIWQVTSGRMTKLKDDGNKVMTNPSTLSDFIKYCASNFPANRMELIFWDHGGGSISGYGYDEKNASSGSMNLTGINRALKDGGVKFDFIGFDACLMATAETGLMLADYADYMIASEETEPGVGWYYTDWLNALSNNTSMSTLSIGQKICDSFVAECNRTCPGQSTTLSVVDLAELEHTLPQELKDFAAATSRLIDSQKYDVVSSARTGAREFAASTKIDQVDLVHLCYNMGTSEGTDLAKAVLGAVKYNVTSSNMTNAYGLSIYFPYQRLNNVDNAVATMDAIGMDSEYAQCIQKFASVETSGQAISGGASSPLSALLSSYTSGGQTASGSDMISSLLGGLLGGKLNNVSGLTGLTSAFLGRGLDVESTTQYLTGHSFDSSKLKWKNGLISLPEEQWALINDLELNLFFDDGAGYIDLGFDNYYDFNDNGALVGEFDGTWLAINSQNVAYYHLNTVYEGESYTITGRVPCLINGDRADLIIVISGDGKNTETYRIAGARYEYMNGETETVAKALTELNIGDVVEPVCDYYSYSGVYRDSYRLGDPLTYNGDFTVSYVTIDSSHAVATYCFTDIYGQTYWTETF